MKRIIAVFLTLTLVLSVSFLMTKGSAHTTCDSFVYNYLDHGNIVKTTVNLDDYLALGRGMNEIYIYDKKSGEMILLGEDVFDMKKQYTFPVFASGNTLYYTAKDTKLNASGVYSFNIDTYEKKRIYAKAAMTDPECFLGLNEILGIYNYFYVPLFSQVGKYILFDGELMTISDALTLLSEKDKDGSFTTDIIEGKISGNQKGIFILNKRNNLVFYDFEKESFLVFSEEKINDFFLTENEIYYVPLESPGRLYKTDLNFNYKQYIAETDITDVRVQNNNPAFISDGEAVYKLENDSLTKIFTLQDEEIRWEADKNGLWLYDAETMRVERIVYSK